MDLVPTLGRQRQVDLYKFKASWVYIESSRSARVTWWDFFSKKKKKKPANKKQKVDKHSRTCLFSLNAGNINFFFQIPVFIGYSFPYFNKSSNCQVDSLSHTLNCLQSFIRLFDIIFMVNKCGNLKIKKKQLLKLLSQYLKKNTKVKKIKPSISD